MQEFARSFNNADVLYITDIYAASEIRLKGDSGALTAAIKPLDIRDVNDVGALDNAPRSCKSTCSLAIWF